MNFEKLIYQIEEKFGIKERKKESFLVSETNRGEKIFGEKKYIEFETPQGVFRLEETRKPKILDKKILAGKRIGARTAVEYIWSSEEKSVYLKLYKKENGDWQEIDIKGLI